jgi:hypothetical protein
MAFNLHVAQPGSERRPGAARKPAASAGTTAALMRGVALGFVGAFVVFDWVLLGGATTRSLMSWTAHLLLRPV